MASKWINVKGRVKWCKPYEPEEFAGDTRWTTNFYPFSEKEWEKIEQSGMQLEKKNDELGDFIRIRRPCKKLFGKDDEITKFTPPKITGAVNVSYVDSKTNGEIRSYKKSDDIGGIKIVGDQALIGNESVVIANICVYDTSRGKGHRWEGLNVLDLVEYTRSATFSDPETTEEEKVPVQPAKEKTKATGKTTKSVAEDMDDEIPFDQGASKPVKQEIKW